MVFWRRGLYKEVLLSKLVKKLGGKTSTHAGDQHPEHNICWRPAMQVFSAKQNTGTRLKYLLLIQHKSDNECDTERLSVLGFQADGATALMAAIWLQVKTTDFAFRICDDKVWGKKIVSLFLPICLLLYYLFLKLVQTSLVVLFTHFKSPIQSTACPDWLGIQNPC